MEVLTYESYKPNPRQLQFHRIQPVGARLIKGYIGGLGSGKSTACEQEQAMICMKTPGGKSIAVRAAMTKADSSLIDDYRRLLKGHARYTSRDTFEFRNGHMLYILPGDDWNRYGSNDIVSFYIQEAHEVDWEIFDALTQRLRHPAGTVQTPKGPVPYYRGLFCARGVRMEHWIYKQYCGTEEDPIAWSVDMPEEERMKVGIPSFTWVRGKTRDNKIHLPEDYEADLIAQHKNNVGWQKLLLEGEFGFDIGGIPVYGDYNPSTHNAHNLQVDERLPILRGWDFGYNSPAVVFCQFTSYGALHVLDELTPKQVSIWELIDEVKALQANRWGSRHPAEYRDFGDIAGLQENSTGWPEIEAVERSLATSVESRPGRIRDGVQIVRRFMTRTRRIRNGLVVPMFRVDQRCVRLREALGGAYFYKSDKTDERPVKGNGYDDVADAVRYVAQGVTEYDTEEEEDLKKPHYPRRDEKPSSFGSYN